MKKNFPWMCENSYYDIQSCWYALNCPEYFSDWKTRDYKEFFVKVGQENSLRSPKKFRLQKVYDVFLRYTEESEDPQKAYMKKEEFMDSLENDQDEKEEMSRSVDTDHNLLIDAEEYYYIWEWYDPEISQELLLIQQQDFNSEEMIANLML